MKYKWSSTLSTLIAYTLITTSFARTLYVAPHGSDQHDGSSSEATRAQ